MSSRIANTVILITTLTLLSKLTGFIRDVVLASTYGTTMNSDAFIMAQSITGVITSLALAALGTTFIPVMSDYIQHRTKEETNKFLNVIYTVTISFTLVITVLGIIFVKQVVNVFAPSFSGEAYELTVQLTSLMLPLVVLTAIVTLGSAQLQNHGRFLIPAAIGFPLNFTMILTMLFLTDAYGIQGLTIAVVVGTFLQVILQMPSIQQMGYRFRFDFDLKEEGLRRIGLLIIPIMIGSGIQQINTIVDRILASGLPEGSVAALNYSNRLSLFIIGLLSAAVVSIYYTSMSNYFSTGQGELFKRLLRNTINVSTILIIPASIGFLVLRLPIVQLIFQRGLFDSAASEMTAIGLFYYTIGLIGFLLRDVLSRAFYALKDTKTAMINGSITVGFNIVLSIVLVRYMGLGGLALGTSISGIIGTVLLMYSLHKKIGNFGLRNIIITFSKVLMASIVMGVIVHYGYDFLYVIIQANTAAVIISMIAGFIIYGIMIFSLKIEEVRILKQMMVNRVKMFMAG